MNSLCDFYRMVEEKYKYIKGLEESGKIRVTPLGDCYFMVKSTTNSDLRIIIAMSDNFDTSENTELMGSTVKLVYALIKMIFEENINLDEYITVFGGRSGLTLKSVIAKLYRESKLVPVVKFDVYDYTQPKSSSKTTVAKIILGYAYVQDSRSLKEKIGIEGSKYIPKVDDKLLYTFSSEMTDIQNSIQKVYTLRATFYLDSLANYLKNTPGNERVNLTRSVKLLGIIVDTLSRMVRVPVLPVDYTERSIGKPLAGMINHSMVVTNTLTNYPGMIKTLYQKGITSIGYTLDYTGFKGLFKIFVIPQSSSVGVIGYNKTISSKHINLEGVSVSSIFGKLVPEFIKMITVLTKE